MRFSFIACMCLLAIPIAAVAADAQAGPAPIGSAQPGPPVAGNANAAPQLPQLQEHIVHMRTIFNGIGAQSRSDQALMRHDLLALLTPAQRAWIGTTIGDLSIAADPDAAAVARRIDATLSANQKRAIVQLEQTAMERAQAMFAQALAQSQRELAAQLPADSRVVTQSGGAVVGNVAGPLPAGESPAPGAFAAALANQSAGALIVEILTAGTMESLRPQGVIIQAQPVTGP